MMCAHITSNGIFIKSNYSPITGDVTNLYEEPEMLSAASCTTAAQALMEVEKGSARTMERHKGQGTKTEEWNLRVLVSDKQKYSR